MRPGLDGIISSQHGIFARRQAIGCGVTPREFERHCRGTGPWIKVRYGVYTTRQLWSSLSAEKRLLLKDRAALLVCANDAVLSHCSAARALGLPLYDVDPELSHVTRIGESQTSRIQAGINHHLAALPTWELCEADGMRVTTEERTVADLARKWGFRAGLVAADAALGRGADRAVLTKIAERMAGWGGGPNVGAVVEAADGRAQTPIETLGRLTLINMGITDLELQHVIWFSEGGYAEGDIYSKSLNHLF